MNSDKYEKVIKGLKCCTKQPNEYGECMSTDCPYKGADCCRNVMADALVILGAQEPVKPHESNGHTGKSIWICGNCGVWIGDHMVSFCWHCGRAVKWND